MEKLFLVYFLAVSLAAVIMCCLDKSLARNRSRRISEKALFTVSALGGAAAMYITMLFIRHKTKHKRFMIGLPLIIAAQTAVLIFLLSRY